MVKLIKQGFIVLIAFLVLNQTATNAAQAALFQPQVSAAAAILVDQQTGQVVAQKNSRQRLPIASISKLLVIYLIEQKIACQQLKPQQTVTITPKIAALSQDHSVANVSLSTQQKYTIRQLETAALLPSSNSAAMALAQVLAGSQEKFCRQAEQLLQRWGISRTHWYTASGLRGATSVPARKGKFIQENCLSAREVAIVAQHLLQDYPKILHITQQTQAAFPQPNGHFGVIHNTNSLLQTSAYHFQGLKTGTTAVDGQNFVGVTRLKGRPVITVVLNAPAEQQFKATTALLNQATRKTQVVNLRPQQSIYVANAQTTNNRILVRSQKKVTLFFRPNDKSTINSKMHFVTPVLQAPLAKNKVVSQQTIRLQNPIYNDYLTTTPQIRYQTVYSVKRATWYQKLSQQLQHWFKL